MNYTPHDTDAAPPATVETQRTCKQCGTTFHKPPSAVRDGRGNFCSRVCHYKFKSAQKKGTKPAWLQPKYGPDNPNWRGGRLHEATCPICGTLFTTRYNKTCSERCGHILQGLTISQTGNGNWIDEDTHLRKNYRKLIDLSACHICRSSRPILAHHIDGNRLHNTADNLLALCYSCHTVIHCLALGHARPSNLAPNVDIQARTTWAEKINVTR